ncbi:MAG TPA: nicotinate-nicotinamide nucleotide adenylyltransferase [Bryobacteraceae bacterium]|nr:nicotinate-nicotinamide nucleotide adenylyltransferase [Bryobacteraceae bacterium]
MIQRLGILAGAFNPLTRAHLALIEAAIDTATPLVDQVVCVVPRVYPHKEFHGAQLEQRLEMLDAARGAYDVELTDGGLFIDIARELRTRRPHAEAWFICGRDAAERILGWDYGEPGAIDRILDEIGLLVAARQGEYKPPDHLRERVRPLAVPPGFDDHSSTEVRRRISAGEPWEHLVPESIENLVRKIYVG